MRPKPWYKKKRYYGILTVALLIADYGWAHYKFASNPLLSGIGPKYNEDGTVDYTLINRRYERRNDRVVVAEGAFWTLRLPAEFEAKISEASKSTFYPNGFGGSAINLNSRPNEYFSFDLSWPKLGPKPPEPEDNFFWNSSAVAEVSRAGNINVFISNSYYGDKTSETFDKFWEDKSCVATDSFGDGFQFYESSGLATGTTHEGCHSRFLPKSTRYFVLRDPSGAPIAQGTCGRRCNVDTFVLGHRTNLTISTKLIKKLPSILPAVVARIEEFTVKKEKITWK